ncbi:MAG: CDP-alcohol phosphatidyltransferase family protein [Geminicoccaceae bacterium]|nr:CDP-alcohol phosphatidyltransferase family protein [Geminicoccaceae bacterium]MDW8369226.1 CDP-alcohol phosphatidyltransferase family protein [Geminicoccaceae bacterium]
MAVATSGRPVGYLAPVRRAALCMLRLVLPHLANALTASRMVAAVPVSLLVLDERDGLAFWIFLAAALTDLADGYVAKRWASPSRVGAALDPVADKLFVGCLLLALAERELVPVWLVALAIGRDVMLVVGAVLLRSRLADFRIEPLVIGKVSTFVQLLLLGFVLGHEAGIADVAALVEVLIAAAATLTIASALAYLAAGIRLGLVASRPA